MVIQEETRYMSYYFQLAAMADVAAIAAKSNSMGIDPATHRTMSGRSNKELHLAQNMNETHKEEERKRGKWNLQMYIIGLY